MASSTMSLNVRSSSFGGGIMESDARLSVYTIRSDLLVVVLHVEREDEVALFVLAGDRVLDADVEPVRLVGIRPRPTLHVLDARFEFVNRFLAKHRGHRGGELIVRREHQIVNLAAELGAVDPLTRCGA